MEDHYSIRQWQTLYKCGAFKGKDRSVQIQAGWYDWFCRDDALLGRLKKLAPAIIGITDPFILDHYYLWLKNNCPVKGPLYDDIRFEPLEGERDGKYFLIMRDSPYERQKWSLYTERNGFDSPEFECSHVRDMVAYVNRLGHELEQRIPYQKQMQTRRLYIAYGSNLNIQQMQRRCPTAKVVATAALKDWRLRFRGEHPYGAVATIEPQESSHVPVLIWDIRPSDEKALDVYEGYPRLYRKEMLTVTVNGEDTEAMVYIMNADQMDYAVPSQMYFNTIVQGYQENNLDLAVLFEAAYRIERRSHMMTKKIKEQILAVRDTGETNMFDVNAVQYIADREGFYELVCYLIDNRTEYAHFIMTGEAEFEDEDV